MFSVDIRSREPIYVQLEKSIIKNINLKIIEADYKLPSVRSLAIELGINPNTVSKAYNELEKKGVLYTIPGKGAFVNGGNSSMDIVQKISVDKFKVVTRDTLLSGVSANKLKNIIEEMEDILRREKK